MDIYIEHFHHKKNKKNKHPTKKERREEKKSNYLLIENTECPRHRCAGPVRDREKLDELNDNFFFQILAIHINYCHPFIARNQDAKIRKKVMATVCGVKRKY
jgi:hypothetical protein